MDASKAFDTLIYVRRSNGAHMVCLRLQELEIRECADQVSCAKMPKRQKRQKCDTLIRFGKYNTDC